MIQTRIVQIGATVEEVLDGEEVAPFMPTPARASTWTREPPRPTVRDSGPVLGAVHLAALEVVMKDLGMTNREAARFIEIEQQYTGIALPRREQ